MRGLVVAVAVAGSGCSSSLLSPQQVQHRVALAEARTTEAYEAARAEFLTTHGLRSVPIEELRPYPIGPFVEPGPTAPTVLVASGIGLEPGERIVSVPGKDGSPAQVAFEYPSRCGCGGCDTSVRYELATGADGSVVVLRFVAVDHVVEKRRQRGACTSGCGVAQPPAPPLVTALPTSDAARVRVEKVRFDRYLVLYQCEVEHPAP